MIDFWRWLQFEALRRRQEAEAARRLDALKTRKAASGPMPGRQRAASASVSRTLLFSDQLLPAMAIVLLWCLRWSLISGAAMCRSVQMPKSSAMQSPMCASPQRCTTLRLIHVALRYGLRDGMLVAYEQIAHDRSRNGSARMS